MKTKSKTKQNLILLLAVLILIIVPFFMAKGGSFAGSDDQGTEQIKKFDPSYKVWLIHYGRRRQVKLKASCSLFREA